MHDEDREWRTFQARIPLTFHLPSGIGKAIVEEVLGGEYESGYTGERLIVLDIGANIGAFSLWAAHRWPGCTIDAYEPNPATFALLERNTRSYPMIRCHNVAVYPSGNPDEAFFFRGAGDGQAGLVEELASTFGSEAIGQGEQIQVPVLHPRELPGADVIKIDVEGAEAAIITHAELSGTSLILLEFQHRQHLETIKAHLAGEFDVAFERRKPWSAILSKDAYQPSLAGDEYGVLFLVRRGQTRLRRPPEAGLALQSRLDEGEPSAPVERPGDRLIGPAPEGPVQDEGRHRLGAPEDEPGDLATAAPPPKPRSKKGPLRRLKKLLRRMRENISKHSKSNVKG